jgi:outer membrane protein TolC
MHDRTSPGALGRPGARAHAARFLLAAGLTPVLLACAGPGLARRHHAAERSWRESAGPELGGRESATDLARDDADPFAGAARLERAALVDAVLRRNPSIGASRFAWKAALARYPQETSLEDPMLGYGVAPRSFGSDLVHDGHRVEISQRLPFPGKLSLRGEIALAEAEAARSDFEAVRLRLASMASFLFDELWLLERSLAINAEHLALLGELRRIAVARYEVGEASQQDPLQAEVEEAHLLHRELSLEAARRVAREQVNLLLHRATGAALPPLPEAPDPPRAWDADREALAREALAASPELWATQARVEGRASAVALARREFLPDFDLIGAYDRIWQERELQPFVGVQMNVPLRISRRRAALAEAEARLAQAESERAGLEDEVRFAVASGAERLEEAHHVLHLYEQRLLPAARDQVEAARAGFETGRNDFLALIGAERNLRDVRLGYEEALAELSRRHSELERALGRLPGPRGGTLP